MPVGGTNLHAVAGVGAHLLATDVELHGAIDRRSRGVRSFFGLRRCGWAGGRQLWSVLEPRGLQIFEEALSAAFASVTALAVSTESAGSVEQVRAVHPDDTGFELRGHLQGDVDVLAPDAGCQTID